MHFRTTLVGLAAGTALCLATPATAQVPTPTPGVSVTVLPAAVDEDDAVLTFQYLFTRDGDLTNPLTVNFSVGGTAAFGPDYGQSGADTFNASTGTVTFPALSPTVAVTIDPAAETLFETDETVVLTVIAGTGYDPADPTSATGTITNDDAAPALSIDDVTHDEGNSGTTSYTFTVTRTGSTAVGSTVEFTTQDGTATVADSDYQTNSGTLTFAAGDTTQTITVLVNGDTTYEATEAFTVHLSNASDATITDADGTGTITNDDAAPALSIDDVTHDEGNSGTTSYIFTVTRTGSTAVGSTVDFTTQDGTATVADSDYQTNSGTLIFAAGDTTKTITVLVNGDTKYENGEAFTVHLSNASDATISDADGTGTITNDDAAPTLSIDDVTHDEGNSGTTSYTFTVTRTGSTAVGSTVDFTTQDGTATVADSDYQTNSGTLIFAAGDTTKTITVLVNGDTKYEATEAFTVHLSNASDATISDADGTGTITNDDDAPILSIDDVTHDEGNSGITSYTFTVTRTGSTGVGSTVDFTTQDGTATVADSDYQTNSGTLTFAAGDMTKTITVLVNGDTIYEATEAFTVHLSNASDATITDADGTGTITNDDAAPTLSIDDVTHDEGNAGTTSYTFTVTRTGSTAVGSTVDFTTQDGTATVADSDYQTNSGTLTFAVGDTTKTITVLVNGDTKYENGEAFTVHLSNASDATISDADGTGTITNDDAAPALSIDDVTHDEGDGGTTSYIFTVSRTGSTAVGSTVDFTTQDGTATVADSDYQTNSGTLTFAAGDTTKTITVLVNGDTKYEATEAFTVHLSNASDATISDADATGTITNDDAAPTLSIDDVTHDEGNSGTTSYTFTVTRTGSTAVGSTVEFTTQDGTATVADSDYQTNSGTLTFAAGDTTQTITVLVNGDTIYEATEAFTVHLSNASDATISDADGTGTITNDDAAPTLSIDDVTHDEGNSGTTSYSFTVTRTGSTAVGSTVDFTTQDGTATVADSDYQTNSGTLIFAAGDTTKTITVLVNGDTKYENGEAFTVQLSNASDATITDADGTGTITNDDAAPTLSIDDVTHDEGDSGTTSYTFTVTRTGSTAVGSTVDFTTQDGTATVADSDYQTNSGTLIFAAGDTTKTITVLVNGDTTVEPNEAFTVHLSNAADATITDADGTGTITNDDTAVSVTVSPASVLENGTDNLVYTFTRTGITSGSITVNFSVGGTASFGSDYTQSGAATFGSSSGTVTFGDGVTTAVVTVDPATDTVYESNETVILTVISGTGYNPGVPAAATGTITNDDNPPTLGIGDRIAFEGNGGGTTNFVFTVTKTGSTEVPVTVQFATADGTTNPAIGGGACGGSVDYVSQNGSLNFLANETSKTITIAVCRDATVEPNETFFVELSAPTDATISDGEGRGTIQNDDSPGTALVVNTTQDHAVGPCEALPTGDCTLREAITAAGGSPGADVIAINFAIPATDPHFYYADDGIAGQVTLANVTGTTNPDDTAIVGIDPDWPHSWWSIQPGSNLPSIGHAVVIDGYTQTGASANTLAGSNNAVLKIELSGASAGGGATGLTLGSGGSTVRGLVINRFTVDGVAMSAGNSAVAGNFIGTDVSGSLDLGNTGNGISSSSFSETIGGSTAAEANLISGNDGSGISFANSNSDLVLGNLIGTKSTGSAALGNGGNGITLSGGGSVFNTIGGTEEGDGNTIAFNAGDGVQLASAGIGNAIRGNSISSNGSTLLHLGIDLGTDGVTPNDPKDPDTGPNSLQNFPTITSALVTGSTRTVKGTLNSTDGQTFTIDFYANAACDSAGGNGEGQTYLGSVTTDVTDSNGDVSFTFHPDVSHAPAMTVGKVITATATSTGAVSNTSEFSACFEVADGSSGAGDIQFTSATYNVGEAGGNASITVTRVGGSNGSVTTNFSTSDGTAQAPGDYTAVTNFAITYAEGETDTRTVNIPILNDTTYEGDETVNLALSGTQIVGATPNPSPTPHAAVLTIVENDSSPIFTIDDVTHDEGNAGTTSYTFTVTKNGSTALSSTVDYQTVNGTAAAPGDFTAISTTTLNFGPTDTSKQFTVFVNGDVTNEANEAFTAQLSNATNATIADADGTGTITNDDPVPTVEFSSATYAVGEGGGTVTITVTKTGATDSNATVHYATSNGSATASSDYSSTSGDLTFAPSENSKQFTVPITEDTIYEGDENFSVTLSAPAGATLGTPSSATVTITENDPPPTVQLSSSGYSVNEGAGTVTLTVTKTGATALSGTVHYATSDGSAGASADYTATSGDVTFAPGETSKDIMVPITNDAFFEASENFTLTLSAPTNATLGSPSSATVTITDNDAAPTVQFSSATYNVNEGGGTATLTVTKTGATALPATVHYATSDGSASVPADYTATSGDVTFAPGEVSKDITVPIANDAFFEGDENFSVTLSAPGNATLGTPSSTTVTIVENDAAPVVQLSAGAYSVGEAGGTVTITVTKTGATAVNATVHYATSDGSATAPADYGATSGDVTFGPNETSKQFTVPIVDDAGIEPDETFNVTLSAPSSATIGSPSSATVTITDNDTPPTIQWSSATYNVNENGSNAVLTVTRTGNNTTTAIAHYFTTNGTATAGQDYTASSGDITFTPGGPDTQNINIPITDDTVFEGDETFSATLNAVAGGSIGTPQVATVTITENDPQPTPTPSPTPTATPTATPTPTASPTATPTPTPTATPAQALNISTRLRVETGDKVMIGGFIITGNASKKVVLRGMGPSLTSFGLKDVLADPVLELRGGGGALISQNDNWKDTQRSQIEGTAFEPTNDLESVIIATLQPGDYTAILTGKDQTTGVGLVEIYDIDQAADSSLANISTRGFVQTADNVMIGGFVLGGNPASTRVAVRGLGPSLSQFGLSNLLEDPTLELHDGNGTLLISNDNWQDDPASAAQLTASGLNPSDLRESGIFTTLPPGAFTAILAGKDGGIGIGLVEVYNLK